MGNLHLFDWWIVSLAAHQSETHCNARKNIQALLWRMVKREAGFALCTDEKQRTIIAQTDNHHAPQLLLTLH
ncbi:hypothetical protein OAF45_00395 [Candidatus Latescibacteria bacterium]|nr:hypothetical protein [Candidatus Latescibacterota bacterium]